MVGSGIGFMLMWLFERGTVCFCSFVFLVIGEFKVY